MCLTIPGRVVEIKENGDCIVDYEFEKREVNMSLVDDLNEGDFVIVNNKIIVSKVNPERARKFLEIFENET